MQHTEYLSQVFLVARYVGLPVSDIDDEVLNTDHEENNREINRYIASSSASASFQRNNVGWMVLNNNWVNIGDNSVETAFLELVDGWISEIFGVDSLFTFNLEQDNDLSLNCEEKSRDASKWAFAWWLIVNFYFNSY